MTAMTDLLSQPMQEDSSTVSLDADEPHLSFVSYTVPQDRPQKRKQITTFESRGLIYGSGSTGFRTWEAALHLGTYLSSVSSDESSPVSVRGKRVVELGAGTGFLSLLCQKFLGSDKVLMTDGNAKLADVFNGPCLEQNGFVKGKDAIEGRQWLWGEPLSIDGAEEQFDIAFGADLVGPCFYEHRVSLTKLYLDLRQSHHTSSRRRNISPILITRCETIRDSSNHSE